MSPKRFSYLIRQAFMDIIAIPDGWLYSIVYRRI